MERSDIIVIEAALTEVCSKIRLQNIHQETLAGNYSPEDYKVVLRLWEQCRGLVGSNDDDVDGSIDEGSAGPPAGIQLRSVVVVGGGATKAPLSSLIKSAE